MKIYKISQTKNQGYDTYDSAIVYAENSETAKRIHPCDYMENWNGKDNDTWCDIEFVVVEYIGEYHLHTEQEEGLILASFNAG